MHDAHSAFMYVNVLWFFHVWLDETKKPNPFLMINFLFEAFINSLSEIITIKSKRTMIVLYRSPEKTDLHTYC